MPVRLPQESIAKQLRPSIRRQRKAATRGERFNLCRRKIRKSVRPEQAPFSQGPYRGASAQKIDSLYSGSEVRNRIKRDMNSPTSTDRMAM